MASLLLVRIARFVTLNCSVMAFMGCHELCTEQARSRQNRIVIRGSFVPRPARWLQGCFGFVVVKKRKRCDVRLVGSG